MNQAQTKKNPDPKKLCLLWLKLTPEFPRDSDRLSEMWETERELEEDALEEELADDPEWKKLERRSRKIRI